MLQNPQADQYTLDTLKANADIIEEVTALITYIGMIKPQTPGTDADKQAAPVWTIAKIEQSAPDGTYPNTTTVKFADGIAAFNKVWNDRAGYNYTFKLI